MPEWLISLGLAAIIIGVGVALRQRPKPKTPESPREAMRRKFRVVEGGLKEPPQARSGSSNSNGQGSRGQTSTQPRPNSVKGPDEE